MSMWGQVSLLDPATPIQSEMILFHDHALSILIGIFVLVTIIGLKLILNSYSTRFTTEAQTLEIIWTIIPAFLLVWLAFPSLRLLYLLDEQPGNGLMLKAIGHQWYWSYESASLFPSSFDSYMIPTNNLNDGEYRLLEVDNRPYIPLEMNTSIISTSTDVIHAFALPSMGVKMDSVPGRLNMMAVYPTIPGVYYGQCSEICGANHSFMPITIEVVSTQDL